MDVVMTVLSRRSSGHAAVGRVGLPLLLVLFASSAGAAAAKPLPRPVHVRPEPEGVMLGDPAFEPLPGARAEYGRLGGSVYQLEVPRRWNGRLVLYLHGYGELRPTAEVSP